MDPVLRECDARAAVERLMAEKSVHLFLQKMKRTSPLRCL